MISFSYVPLIRYYLIISAILTSSIALAQTTTTSDGNWNTGANWSSGVPTSKTKATVTNDMTMNVNITIDKNGGDRGEIIVNGGSIDTNGTPFNLSMIGTGYLEVGGNVTIGGDFELRNDANFIIKACDTFRIIGNVTIENNTFFDIEACAVLYIEGNALIQNNNTSNVDGNIYIEGDLTVENNAFVAGTGNLEVEGDVEIKNAGSIFGNTTDCIPGPCEYGSGEGLPITLDGLNASYISSSTIKVDWTTISEINNDYFTLFISTDGDQFFEVKRIMGSGNSYSRKSYETMLNNLGAGIKYLKLKQTDFDGQSEEFGPFKISKSQSIKTKEELIIAPNPGNGKELMVLLKNLEAQNYQLQLISSSGLIITDKEIRVEDDNFSLRVNLITGFELKSGIYYLKLSSLKNQISKKYIVH